MGAALPTKEETIIRTLMFAAVSAAALLLSPIAFAQQTGGTADEAKAMLMKAVAAVKADKAKALDMFNKGEGGFLDRDLYVFCSNVSDGKTVAIGNPNAKLLGTDTGPSRTPPAKLLAQNSSPHTRSRKEKSPRSATCFPGRARTRRRFRR